MADPITRDDLTVTTGTGRHGGTDATVIINAGPFSGRAFTMRSTEGLPNVDLNRGGGFHVHAGVPDDGHRDWRGAFRTYDLDEALTWLVDYVNSLAERAEIEGSTWAERSALGEAVEAFGDALEESSRHDFRERWQQVREAVAAIEIAMGGGL